MKNKIDEKKAVKALEAAFDAIASNDLKLLQERFARDAVFFGSGNPYRLDDLKTFKAANHAFFEGGGAILNVDVRQPRVQVLSDCVAAIAFHFSQRVELAGMSHGSHGQGSAILLSENSTFKVVHLHLSENAGRSLPLPTAGMSPEDVLGAFNRIGTGIAETRLPRAMWGCE